MSRLALLVGLSLLSATAAAQTCQNATIVSQSLRDEPGDIFGWEIVRYHGSPADVQLGVECEVSVTLPNPNANGVLPAAGQFEGVRQSAVPSFTTVSIVRQLAIDPSLAANDELSFYELSTDNQADSGREEVLARIVSKDSGAGTVYLLRLKYLPEQTVPQVSILLAVPYQSTQRLVQCANKSARICLTSTWTSAFSGANLLKLRLNIGGKPYDATVNVTGKPPLMRLGYLGAVHPGGGTSVVTLKHRICEINTQTVANACNSY